jgi:hypothetical protein
VTGVFGYQFDDGVGRILKIRGEQAKVEFNPSLFKPPPYRSENKILDFAEMERVETPLERAGRGQWDEPWRFELRIQAARFLTGNKGMIAPRLLAVKRNI